MKHRLFVALPVSPQLQKKVLRWQKNRFSWPIRWIKPENLHVTLIPPWYNENVKTTIDLLHKVRGAAASEHSFGKGPKKWTPDAASPYSKRTKKTFSITFHHITFGPDPRKPRLIWAEGEVPNALPSLKTHLEKVLRRPGEKRPFRLHLTLARFRQEDFARFPIKKLDEKIDWRQKIKSFALMESHLTPRGANYQSLATFPFS